MPAFTLTDLIPVLPELMLAGGALVLVLIGAIRGDGAGYVINGIAIAILAAAGAVLFGMQEGSVALFGNSFVVDGYAKFLKLLVLIAAVASLALGMNYMRAERLERFEYAILVVLATLGMLVMISANDLIALYLGLELQSLSLYVIAAFHRDSARSSEAGLKYFVLGALSSGMLLYGCSLVYGYAGTVGFQGIAAATASGDASLGLIFGLVFLLAGLAFKISAVPFHMWTPDVYEGAPTPVTAFFAAAPKVAAMAILVRVVVEAFPGIVGDWQQIIVFLSIASMLLGAFAAIGQRNIKRLMAYSSIGHVGFALMGLAAGTEEGIAGVLIYLAIYIAMTLGTFACILAMRRKDGMVEDIAELSGLARTHPMMAFLMAMLMFSLAGIPPLAGFFAKIYVFYPAVTAGLWPLVVIGVIASTIGAYYYLRIVKIIYFDEPRTAFEPMAVELRAVLGLASLIVLFFFIYPQPITFAATDAARSLF